jgi:hypothetical protein
MPLELKLHENVLFPMPYVPTEQNLFIVTNQRVIHYGENGHTEIPSSDVAFVGRLMVRPRQLFGVLCLLAALPLIVVAIWQLSTVWGMESAGPLALFSSSDAPDPDAPPPPEGADPTVNWPLVVLKTRILVIALAICGAGLVLGGLKLLKKKHYFVICRGAQRVVKVQAKDEIQQTQILMTISAVKGKVKPPS